MYTLVVHFIHTNSRPVYTALLTRADGKRSSRSQKETGVMRTTLFSLSYPAGLILSIYHPYREPIKPAQKFWLRTLTGTRRLWSSLFAAICIINGLNWFRCFDRSQLIPIRMVKRRYLPTTNIITMDYKVESVPEANLIK